MIKPIKKYSAILASLGLVACLAGTSRVKANKIIYDDSNVSIAVAVGRYVTNLPDVEVIEDIDTVNSATVTDADSDEMTADNTDIIGDEVPADTEAEEEETLSGAIAAPSTSPFEGKAIVAIGDYVNIRSEADVESERIGKIAPGGVMDVIEKGSEWSVISSGNCYGYIKNEFLAFDLAAEEYADNNLNKMAVVNTTTLRVRAEDSEDSQCLTLIPEGEKYGILEQGSEWTYIEVDDLLAGYVKNEYIDVTYQMTTAISVEEEEQLAETDKSSEEEQDDKASDDTENIIDNEAVTDTQTEVTENVTVNDDAIGQDASTENNTNVESISDTQIEDEQTTLEEITEEQTTEASVTEAPAEVPVSASANDVVNYALQFVGNPYVYGGTSLTDGTDCSGFTMSVYAHFGVSLSRVAADQANNGTEVSLLELQPGDLVFYDHGTGYIGHVALYIGNGQIVHASTSLTGIIVASVNYSTPCKAVRLSY